MGVSKCSEEIPEGEKEGIKEVIEVKQTERTRARMTARIAVAVDLGLEPRSCGDNWPHLVLKVPENLPLESRVQDCLAVYWAGVIAEKQIYGSYTGDRNVELENLTREFHLKVSTQSVGETMKRITFVLAVMLMLSSIPTHGQERLRIFVKPIPGGTSKANTTAGVESELAKRCKNLIVTEDKEKADYILEYSANGNEFVLFNHNGDLIQRGSATIYHKAIEKVCKAIKP